MQNKPHLALDGYKTGHKFQYPEGTQVVYSNLTARSARLAKMPSSYDNKVVFVGLQGFIKEYLIQAWNEGFFMRPKAVVVREYKRRMDNYLGPDAVDVAHIAELHDLGYLPLMIKALPEGSRVDIKVPMMTVRNTLPRASQVEVLFENAHVSNLVSLVAPADPTSGNLFKWDNKFSWSYAGEMADSIKERVKKAGGNVTGELCCRLAWDYTDDLDFHMHEPNAGHIYFGTRRRKSACGGELDVDANGADGQRSDPVENIFYERISAMKEGVYSLKVNNYSRRSSGIGFEVEIDIMGTIHRIVYDKVIKDGATVEIAKLKYSRAKGIEIIDSLPSTQAVKNVWNIPTQTFHKVNVMMLSPNFWDEKAVGNKHYFFMLEGCKNDGTARGFFNEFLKAELDKHRKVFEVVGSKMKVDSADTQLSGLGFSSTQKNAIICRVTGSFTRTIKVVF